MISPEIAEYAAVCHPSYWRPLFSSVGHPSHFLMLSWEEIEELVHTGSYSLPEGVIPESVRAWRKVQEDLAGAEPQNVDLTEALKTSVEKVLATLRGQA